jgi:ubiquinone/menaquinone biosynthesis C-methylase UbiE
MSSFINPSEAFESQQRFSRRVADYILYRPRYPRALVETLHAEAGLTTDSVVADIGSGTGFSAEQFLNFGAHVFGVEPNAEMRAAGEEYLRDQPNFTSIDGNAEATNLPPASVDFVTAGQALHWFNLPAARVEFARILKPSGVLAFFWNERAGHASPMMAEFEALFGKYIIEQRTAHHTDMQDDLLAFLFANGIYESRRIPWSQKMTYEQAAGRAFSSSYMPTRGSETAAPLEAEIASLFDKYASSGEIDFIYETELYFGKPERNLSA